jgi:hypothetical protein
MGSLLRKPAAIIKTELIIDAGTGKSLGDIRFWFCSYNTWASSLRNHQQMITKALKVRHVPQGVVHLQELEMLKSRPHYFI